MRTDISGLALAAAFFYAGVPASLAESASEGLYRNLSQDISSAAIPSGYKLFLVQPTARGDEDVHQKVEARVQAMLTREGLIVKKGEFGDEGWEGFTYFVFATPDAAARFHMAESDAFYELKIWAGDTSDGETKQLAPEAGRGSMIIAVNSPTSGKTLEQRCTYADFMIGCLSVEPGSKVAIHLVMQEPLLRSAKTDAERNRLVTSRVQKETGGLLSTAEQHLSASQGR